MEASTRREETLVSAMVAPASLPGGTLDSPALAGILDTPLEAMTSIASPAFASVILVVAPMAPASHLAILDPSVALTAAAAASSSHPTTGTLASAPAAAVMEGLSVLVAAAADHAAITIIRVL